jgi:AcrR family transcriptional regulator
MPKGIPLTEEAQEQRRKEIFAASLNLILKKGFTETSMREIAAAAGIGKSTLYDYYKSKDEILVSYYQDELRKIIKRTQKINKQDLTNKEKLTRIMYMHLAYLLENRKSFWRLSMESQRLSAESQAQIQIFRHAYQDLLKGVVADGIQAGEFRPVDPQLTARSILSLLTVAAFTTRPTGTPEEMLDEILSICFEGIQA